jgi:hypothetical protein
MVGFESTEGGREVPLDIMQVTCLLEVKTIEGNYRTHSRLTAHTTLPHNTSPWQHR